MFKPSISSISLISWGTLGSYRGWKEYSYTTKKMKSQFYYTDAFFHMLLGTFIFLNPFTVLPASFKELYRLETTIRNLEETEDLHKIL